jgi:flagellar protein FliO/FliZ
MGLASACPAACLAAGGDDVVSTAEILSLMVSLFLILGAAGAAAWFLRRWQGSLGRREGPLRLEHIIAVGPRERLAMVRAGTRYLVVGITPTAITRIAELQEGEQEAPKAAEARAIEPPAPADPMGT